MKTTLIAIVIFTFLSFNLPAQSPGNIDLNFDPGNGANNWVETIAVQDDGKIVVGGWFTNYNGSGKNYLVRLNEDGSVDNFGNNPSGIVLSLAIQPDGKILVGGAFTQYNNLPAVGIVRLHANGTIDNSFNSALNHGNVHSINILGDGKIIIAGEFSNYNNISRKNIARINSDGSLDTNFNPGSGTTQWIEKATIQPNGKIVIVGEFDTVNGVPKNRIARLDSNGSLDETFTSGYSPNQLVKTSVVQPNGKIIIGGKFFMGVRRLNPDGSLDNNFIIGGNTNAGVNDIIYQYDGKIYLAGLIWSHNGSSARHIIRINNDGTRDNTFSEGVGTSASIRCITQQSDGKLILGGNFITYDSIPRNRIARIYGAFDKDLGVTRIISPVQNQQIKHNGEYTLNFMVKNFGISHIPSLTVAYDINLANEQSLLFFPNLGPGDSTVIGFEVSAFVQGENKIRVYTKQADDQNPSNDTSKITIHVQQTVMDYPYLNTFSPQEFSQFVFRGDFDWQNNTGIDAYGTQNSHLGCAPFYEIGSGDSGVLSSKIFDFTGMTNPVLSFYVAYRTFQNENDELKIAISTNGGISFSYGNPEYYSKGFSSTPSLATLPPSIQQYGPQNSSDWRHEMVNLSAFAGNNNVTIHFVGKSALGNNLFIDKMSVFDATSFNSYSVNATGIYGNLNNDRAQINFASFTLDNPVAGNGVLSISRIDETPFNNSYTSNISATTFSGAIFTPDVVADRHWEISFSGDDYTSTSIYDVIIDISSQLGIVDPDRLYIMKRVDHNSPWVCQSTITEYESGVPVRLVATGFSGFSQFGIGTDDGTLPVDLVSFTSVVNERNVTLNWTTAWEENNMRFDVQRRIAETDETWATVGSVNGSGTTQEQKSYSYLDRNLVTGKYEYRLVQVDFDGNSTADHTLSSHVEIGIPNEFALSQNYPNPFNPTTKIDFQIPVEGLTKLVIYDISGREVAILVNEVLTPGYHTVEFNGVNFASGVYFYRLVSSNNMITKRAVLVN